MERIIRREVRILHLVLTVRESRDLRHEFREKLRIGDRDLRRPDLRQIVLVLAFRPWMEAVVWPPFTICIPVMRFRASEPSALRTVSTESAVAAIPSL